MVNTKPITISPIYIRSRDNTSTHYKTTDTDIQHCIQHITNIPHSVLTGDVNAHATLWHSYIDDHTGQQITDVISNSDHITLNAHTNQSAKHHKKLRHQISPRCLTHHSIGHHGQFKTHYHQTTYPASPQSTYDMTTEYRIQQNRRIFTNYKKGDWTQFTEDRPPYPPTYNF